MAAIVEIREKNGGSETATTKTSSTIRFKSADDANVDLNNPIVRPGSGTIYSYEKVLRLYIGGTGPTGAITSPRAFSDSVNGFGAGIDMFAGVSGSYTQPVSSQSNVAKVSGGASSLGNDFFTFTSGAPLAMDVVNTGPFSSPIINTDIGDYLYLQAAVGSGASPGLTTAETLTCAFDET